MGILAASITTRVAAANEEVRRSDLQLIDNALNQALTLLVCPSLSAIMGSNGALALSRELSLTSQTGF
jgi:hypothetical protein